MPNKSPTKREEASKPQARVFRAIAAELSARPLHEAFTPKVPGKIKRWVNRRPTAKSGG
jgi:hypothetical protein